MQGEAALPRFHEAKINQRTEHFGGATHDGHRAQVGEIIGPRMKCRQRPQRVQSNFVQMLDGLTEASS